MITRFMIDGRSLRREEEVSPQVRSTLYISSLHSENVKGAARESLQFGIFLDPEKKYGWTGTPQFTFGGQLIALFWKTDAHKSSIGD